MMNRKGLENKTLIFEDEKKSAFLMLKKTKISVTI